GRHARAARAPEDRRAGEPAQRAGAAPALEEREIRIGRVGRDFAGQADQLEARRLVAGLQRGELGSRDRIRIGGRGSHRERDSILIMSRTRRDEIALWIAVAVVFAPGALALAQRWASAEYFQHGFLVPVVSLATAHPRIRKLGPSERHVRALAGLALALAVYALGMVAGGVALTGAALVGAIAAWVGYRWGAGGLRRLPV